MVLDSSTKKHKKIGFSANDNTTRADNFFWDFFVSFAPNFTLTTS